MQRSIWRYIWSSCLLMLPVLVLAQEAKDTLRSIQFPTGLRFGTDLIALGKNYFGSPLASWEMNADLDFGRYYLAYDYGYWDRTETIKNGRYRNDGVYWRLGVDINFLLKDPDKNMFFLGFRYGHSSFNEVLEYRITSKEFDDIEQEATNFGVQARWGEITTGLRVKVWKVVWMGYTARLKIFPSVKNRQQMDVYEIPGFGLAAKNIYWGFNYQLFVRIPFRSEER